MCLGLRVLGFQGLLGFRVFKVLGFRVLGFRAFGFRVWGFKALGFSRSSPVAKRL